MTRADRLPEQAPMIAAVISRVEEYASALGAGVLVGDSTMPPGGGWQAEPGGSEFVPYVVVHDLIPGGFDGPMSGPEEDLVDAAVQLTCVGGYPDQARKVADLARAAMLSGSLTIEGRRVTRVRPDGGPGGVEADRDPDPPVYYATPRFFISTTPA